MSQERRIPLRGRDGQARAYTLVDAADFEALNQWRWSLGTKGYAIRKARPGGTIRMARAIMGLQKGDPRQVDHINGDKLDNRRANLRVVTNAQNRQNLRSYKGSSSRFRGVSLMRGRTPGAKSRWHAYCRVDGKLHTVGFFDTEQEAAAAAAAFRREHMPYSQEAPAA